MDKIDKLQEEIEKAKADLPKESREAIEAVNWRATIVGVNKKYNPSQIDSLEIETELLLCGLLDPENYPKELETRMKISSSEADALVNEMDRLIFKKIQKELEQRLSKGEQPVYDPRFDTLPPHVQDAIAKSGWQKKLYEIGTKNKLKVDKLAALENSTVKMISGGIMPSMYESELASNLTSLDKEALRAMITDINEGVMKVIRGQEQKQTTSNINDVKNIEDEVPIPPYAKSPILDTVAPVINKPTGPTIPLTKTESTIYQRAGIEVLEDKKPKIENVPVENIIASKLGGMTASKPTTSDHSLPKIEVPPAPTVLSIQNETSIGKPGHDPYKEEIV